MRIISSDGMINVPYYGNMFCIIQDEESKKYTISVRNNNLTGFMPLSEYDTLDEAKEIFQKMITADTMDGDYAEVFNL